MFVLLSKESDMSQIWRTCIFSYLMHRRKEKCILIVMINNNDNLQVNPLNKVQGYSKDFGQI